MLNNPENKRINNMVSLNEDCDLYMTQKKTDVRCLEVYLVLWLRFWQNFEKV